jgi:hypothetical protein
MDICEPYRKHLLFYCIYGALHSNGSYPIVAWVFIAAGICLLSRCLEMGLHVKIRRLCNVFTTANNRILTRLGIDHVHMYSTLTHETNWILFLNYKFSLSIYDINNRRFVGLEVWNRKVGFMSSLGKTSCHHRLLRISVIRFWIF